MGTYREVELIDIGHRNHDIGELAMKSFIGTKAFCKAIVLSSFITVKRSSDKVQLDMGLHYELADYVEEAIADQLRVDDRNMTESEVEVIRSTVYREIHQASRWLRNKTGEYVDRVSNVDEIRVAPDFSRGILVVKFQPL